MTNLVSVDSALKNLKKQEVITEEDLIRAIELGVDINKKVKELNVLNEWEGEDDMCEEEVEWDSHYQAEFVDLTAHLIKLNIGHRSYYGN